MMAKVTPNKDNESADKVLESLEAVDGDPSAGGGLDTLRDILFGPQAQATDGRLDGLERSLLQTKKDLSSSIDEEVGSLREATSAQLKTARQELEWQLEKQNNEQSSQLHTLEEEQKLAIDKLASDFDERMQAAQKKLNEKISELDNTVSEKLLEMQAEFRRRDDDLRQQILTLSDWLDERKASREDLSELLIDMGKQLQKVKKSKIIAAYNEEGE